MGARKNAKFCGGCDESYCTGCLGSCDACGSQLYDRCLTKCIACQQEICAACSSARLCPACCDCRSKPRRGRPSRISRSPGKARKSPRLPTNCVQADARARAELIEAQRSLELGLQSARDRIDVERDRLEQDRQALAAAKERESIVASAIGSAALLAAIVLPLVLCIYLIRTLGGGSSSEDLGELLIYEFRTQETDATAAGLGAFIPARTRHGAAARRAAGLGVPGGPVTAIHKGVNLFRTSSLSKPRSVTRSPSRLPANGHPTRCHWPRSDSDGIRSGGYALAARRQNGRRDKALG